MTQELAFKVLKSGANVFLTGPPGSGKSFVLEQFISYCKSKNIAVAVTASTGIAALQIGGSTIHSWCGIGLKSEMTNSEIAYLLDDSTRNKLQKTEVLIIDEISMLAGNKLELIDRIIRLARNQSKPMGGLQVVLAGDLFQLPPVKREPGEKQYVFKSSVWSELDLNCCYLNEQHRQKDDELSEILNAIRGLRLERRHFELLERRKNIALPNNSALMMLTHNKAVDAVNTARLNELKGKVHRYAAISDYEAGENDEYLQIVPSVLELKVGARVMFTANDHHLGVANGTRGIVRAFKFGLPVIELNDSSSHIVEPREWTYESDGNIRRIVQLPLKLAWAITIHKSQGMSIESAVIDLSHSFESGMGYVALSRLKSYNGLYLKGFNRNALRLDPNIYKIDHILKSRSQNIEQMYKDHVERNRLVGALKKAGASAEFINLLMDRRADRPSIK